MTDRLIDLLASLVLAFILPIIIIALVSP